jgi:hypothetical protein
MELMDNSSALNSDIFLFINTGYLGKLYNDSISFFSSKYFINLFIELLNCCCIAFFYFPTAFFILINQFLWSYWMLAVNITWLSVSFYCLSCCYCSSCYSFISADLIHFSDVDRLVSIRLCSMISLIAPIV